MAQAIKHKAPEKLGILYRAAQLGAVDETARTVELAFSSEEVVRRWDGNEILDHGKDSVALGWLSSGNAPLLCDHDPSMQVGVIEKAEIGKDRVGRATVRFSKTAEADAYFQDVKDGIRRNISVGYRVHQILLEEETDGVVTYRIMKWEPFEISLVSIPADPSVGIGRSGEGEQRDITIINKHKLENRAMADNNQDSAANAEAAAAANIKVETDRARADAVKQERTRTTEITALAAKHGMQDRGSEFIKEGKSVEEFRGFILDNIGATKRIDTGSDDGSIGLTNKEARQFSFVKVLRALAYPADAKMREAAAFEFEVSGAVDGRFKGRKFQGNLQIPTDVLIARMVDGMKKRDLTVGSGPAGGYLVSNDLQSGSFIELLRNRMLVKQLGATVLTGLEGNVLIPKQTGGATAYWINENGEPTESQQTVGQVGLTPHTEGAYTEFSRRLLLQSSMDVEMFVKNDLAKVLALAADKAALKGSGTGGEPLGILNTTGIGSVTITTHTFTFGKVVDLESEVATDNADLGRLGYIASAADRGRMKQAEKSSSTGIYIWSNMAGQPGVGEVNGYPAYATNQLADDEMIFGNFEDLIIGEWGVLDMQVNPYSNDKSGGVRITAFQDVDVAVRHAESFARTTAG